MAISKCPKCESPRFELKEAGNISGSNLKMYFIQCSSCGSVVGVVDYYDTASLLEKIAKKMGFKLFD